MTMPQYTEESLDELLKRELIPIFLSLKEHNRSLQNEMSEVNNDWWEKCVSLTKTFPSFNHNSINKRVNTELSKRIAASVLVWRMSVLGECSVLKNGMCRNGWYSSPSRSQTSGSKGAVNLPKGLLHCCS